MYATSCKFVEKRSDLQRFEQNVAEFVKQKIQSNFLTINRNQSQWKVAHVCVESASKIDVFSFVSCRCLCCRNPPPAVRESGYYYGNYSWCWSCKAALQLTPLLCVMLKDKDHKREAARCIKHQPRMLSNCLVHQLLNKDEILYCLVRTSALNCQRRPENLIHYWVCFEGCLFWISFNANPTTRYSRCQCQGMNERQNFVSSTLSFAKKITSPLMMLLVLKLSVRPWQNWVFRFLWPVVMFHCNVLTCKVCCIGLPHLYSILGNEFSPSVWTCCLLHTFQCSWSFSNVVQFCSSKVSKGYAHARLWGYRHFGMPLCPCCFSSLGIIVKQ